ncbi:MAG: helix-turn-helix domain-containing protein [Chitinophagaceae bacterium]
MYKEYRPSGSLSNYIDAYWSNETDNTHQTVINRILPDTCTDIIVNFGSSIHTSNIENTLLEGGKCYLLGTMTRFSEVTIQANTKLFGIRFKPFALRSLLGFSLCGMSNKRIELSRAEFDFRKFFSPTHDTADQNALNSFFTNKISSRDGFFGVLDSISHSGGTISVTTLAIKHYTTERQLERIFREKTGITVKEFCCQVRLMKALQVLKSKDKNQSLLQTAIEIGFYDHAHLNNSIKKYTGHPPSFFIE